MRSNLSSLGFAILSLLLLINKGYSLPTTRSIDSRKTRFSRERVKLRISNRRTDDATALVNAQTPSVASRRNVLLKVDAIIGLIYASAFFIFPAQTLGVFFKYDFDPSIQDFLCVAVRMIAINHLGYVAGLLSAPPEKAIRIATSFLVVGGAAVVYYGQATLDTQLAFWSCTVMTTALILAHLACL